MLRPLIYVLCTSHKIGRLAIQVDAHVSPDHPAIRYVSRSRDIVGVPRDRLFIDILHRGHAPLDVIQYLRADMAARGGQEIEIWKLKAKLRDLGYE